MNLILKKKKKVRLLQMYRPKKWGCIIMEFCYDFLMVKTATTRVYYDFILMAYRILEYDDIKLLGWSWSKNF